MIMTMKPTVEPPMMIMRSSSERSEAKRGSGIMLVLHRVSRQASGVSCRFTFNVVIAIGNNGYFGHLDENLEILGRL